MKLQVLLCAIACSVWSCDKLFDEPTAETLTTGSDPSHSSFYRVDIEMENSTGTTETANLRIHRDGDGNPTCVDVNGFGNSIYSVPLEKRGTGEWKIDTEVNGKTETEVVGTYDRYQKRSTSTVNLAITLHWTRERSSISANNLRDTPAGRLEYLSASLLSGGTEYKYQNDADKKSGEAIGVLQTTPSNTDFSGVTCGS